MIEDNDGVGAMPQAARAATPSEPSPAVSGIAGIPIARTMMMDWNTDHGQFQVRFPSNLSVQDIADIEALLAIAIRGMKRRAQGMETAEAAETAGLSPKGDSPVAKPCAQGDLS